MPLIDSAYMDRPLSMAPTLAKLNAMAERPVPEICRSNYRLGFDHGKAHAYRHIRWALAAVVLIGAVAYAVG